MTQKLFVVLFIFCFFLGSCRGRFQEVPTFRVSDQTDTDYDFESVPPEEQCENSSSCQ